MLFSFFIFHGLSVYKNITKSNSHEVDKYNYSILFLYSPYCHFCQSIKPEWNKFAQVYKNQENIIAGEINCVKEIKLCDKYKIEWFPSFIWIDKQFNSTEILDSHPSYEWLLSFVDTRLSSQSLKILNESQNNDLLLSKPNETIFILYLNEKENLQEQKLFSAACDINSIRNSCYLKPSTEKQLIVHHKDIKEPIIFSNQWDFQNIKSFIKINKYNRILHITKEIYDQFSSTNYPLLLFIVDKQEDINKQMPLMMELSKLLHVSYFVFNPFGFISKTFNIKRDYKNFPILAFIKEKNYVMLNYKNKSEESIKEWLNYQLSLEHISTMSSINNNKNKQKFAFTTYEYHVFITAAVLCAITIFLIILIYYFMKIKNPPRNDCESLLEDEEKELI